MGGAADEAAQHAQQQTQQQQDQQPADAAAAGDAAGDGHGRKRHSTRQRQMPAYLQEQLDEEALAEMEQEEQQRRGKKRRGGGAAAAAAPAAGASKRGRQQLSASPPPALQQDFTAPGSASAGMAPLPSASGLTGSEQPPVVFVLGGNGQLQPWVQQAGPGGMTVDAAVAAWEAQQQAGAGQPPFALPPLQHAAAQLQAARQQQLEQLILQRALARQAAAAAHQRLLLLQQQAALPAGAQEAAAMSMLQALGVLPGAAVPPGAGLLLPGMLGPQAAAAAQLGSLPLPLQPNLQQLLLRQGLPGRVPALGAAGLPPSLPPGNDAFEAAAAAAAAQMRAGGLPGTNSLNFSAQLGQLAMEQQQQQQQQASGAAAQQPSPPPLSPREQQLSPREQQQQQAATSPPPSQGQEQAAGGEAAQPGSGPYAGMTKAQWRAAGLNETGRLPPVAPSPFAEEAAAPLPSQQQAAAQAAAAQAAATAAVGGPAAAAAAAAARAAAVAALGNSRPLRNPGESSLVADLRALEALGWSASLANLPTLSGDLHTLYNAWQEGRVSLSLAPDYQLDP